MEAPLIGKNHTEQQKKQQGLKSSHRSKFPHFYHKTTRTVTYTLWIAFLIGMITYLLIWSTSTTTFNAFCTPTGAFSPTENTFNYNWYSPDGFFQINLAFGSLSFAQAKLIDVIWDICVGRGGQAIIAYISWKALGAYVMTCMAVQPATYTTFWIIFLHKEASLNSCYRLLREFVRGPGLGSRTATTFIIATTIFSVAFSTLASAMTGYNTTNNAFVKDRNGTVTAFSNFYPIAYIIHDAERVGMPNDSLVYFSSKPAGSSTQLTESQNSYRDSCVASNPKDPNSGSSHRALDKNCYLQSNVSNYVEEYGFYGKKEETTTFMGRKLASPTLNISGFYFPNNDLYGQDWRNGDGDLPFQDSSKARYVLRDSNDSYVYTTKNIREDGRCQPVADGLNYIYQWGFSYMQLLVTLSLLWIWAIGIWAMWAVAHDRLPLSNKASKARDITCGWRGILELAEVMKKQIVAAGIDPFQFTDEELTEFIKKQLKGGSLGFGTFAYKSELPPQIKNNTSTTSV